MFLAFIAVVSLGLLWHSFSQDHIKTRHIVVCGFLTRVSQARMGPICDYQFTYMGNQYKASGVGCTTQTKKNFDHGIRNVLIAFSPNDPWEKEILETNDDFEKYRITQNDTVGLFCR
jgi:hypothetical protein